MAHTIIKKPSRNADFNASYLEKLFLFWYRKGRPSPHTLLLDNEFPVTASGSSPSASTMKVWITERGWHDRADDLDSEVARRLEEQAIAEKVEMLRRHADIAVNAQEKAIEYLDENDLDNAHQAIRLLQLGIEVERQSRGLPDVIEALPGMTDDKLINSIKRLVKKSQVQIEQISDDESDYQGKNGKPTEVSE